MMSGNSIYETRKMEIDGYTVTFAAGIKSNLPTVVFGIYTNNDTIPLVTLDKTYPSPDHALGYIRAVTENAGRKLIEYYERNFLDIVLRVSEALNDTRAIIPDPRYRYAKQ